MEFPDCIRISWEFLPLAEPGLAMVFFSATGQGGRNLFSPQLVPRTGYYPQYHSGDIDALHVSYFRHKHAEERASRTCNLRKSAGFELVAADPLPPTEDALDFYRMELVKDGPRVEFSINGIPVLDWMIPERRCWARATSGSGRWHAAGRIPEPRGGEPLKHLAVMRRRLWNHQFTSSSVSIEGRCPGSACPPL